MNSDSNEDECEVDMISNSDYNIATVSDNVVHPNNIKPAIFITKDLVVGDENSDSDSEITISR